VTVNAGERTATQQSRPILDRVVVDRWAVRAAGAVALMVLAALTGCVRAAEPAPAVIRTTPPPWDAPRDAVSTIAAAGLTPEPLNSTGGGRHIVTISIDVDGWLVPIPPYVGVDRPRAQQAAVHTHDASSQVWLEGSNIESITLGQFFTVWAVRFDGRCLGAACGEVVVTADGRQVIDAPNLQLAKVNSVTISARS
jgi:hypothetical protein